MANRLKLTFDLADHPELVEELRMLAVRQRTSQRAIVVEALTAFFSHRQESAALLDAANRTFAEWENEEDQIYDTL